MRLATELRAILEGRLPDTATGRAWARLDAAAKRGGVLKAIQTMLSSVEIIQGDPDKIDGIIEVLDVLISSMKDLRAIAVEKNRLQEK
jgi:hypothetical protein